MSKKDKLTERFLSRPSDFTYEELTTLLANFGFEEFTKGKTAGSRRKFIKSDTKQLIILHKPHPNNIIKNYALKDVLDKLIEFGYIKEKN